MMSYIMKWIERWADITTGWAASLSALQLFGMNLPSLTLTVATVWWTVEKARKERSQRRTEELRARYYAEEMEAAKPVRRGLMAWIKRVSSPEPLDDSQSHHEGK